MGNIFYHYQAQKKPPSLLHLLLNATNKTNGQLYSPEELNKEISKTLLYAEQHDANGTTYPLSNQVNSYLGSSHMTKNLRLLEALGAYQNITNKKEIKRQEKRMVRDDRGGRPSRYRVTTNVETIKYVMNKPEARDLLRNRLFKLNIFYEYLKLVLTGLFYAAKKNKTIIKNLFSVFLPPDFGTIVETLSSINEDEFLNNVARATQMCIDYQKSDIWFILKLFFPFLYREPVVEH